MELWRGIPSRSIFPCLKPQCLGNGRTAGAFRGCATGDEGSRSGEAKLSSDFPSRGLFILGLKKCQHCRCCWNLKENKQIAPHRSRAPATNWIRHHTQCYLLYCLYGLFFINLRMHETLISFTDPFFFLILLIYPSIHTSVHNTVHAYLL